MFCRKLTKIGWGIAETFLTKVALLWIGARGLEFDWKYTQEAVAANTDLLRYYTFVMAVWLYQKRINPKYCYLLSFVLKHF